MRTDAVNATADTAAVARKAARKPNPSESAPQTSGPRNVPASADIWYAATGRPPRPRMMSPTTAAEETPSIAEPDP